MTYHRAPSHVAAFVVPSFPVASALRDRTEEASERAARMRDAGFQEGLRAGRAAALGEVEHAVAEAQMAETRFDAAAEALRLAALDFRERDAASIHELEQETIALAMEIARAIVGREVRSCDAPVLDALQRASQLLPERGAPVLRVHPDDAPIVSDAVAGDRARWTGDATVVADAGIEQGGCIVDVGPCRIDAQISSALARMQATLDPSSSDAV